MPEPVATGAPAAGAAVAGVASSADAPGGVLHLLAPKWRMLRHRMARHERGDRRRVLVVATLGAAFWLGAFAAALRVLRHFRSAEDIGSLLAGKVLAMILMAFGSILLLSNIVAALSNFFLARDLDQLAASPVRAWSLYGARLGETTLHSSWMVALLLVPIVAAYGVAYAAGPLFVPVALLVLVPFLAIPAALGSAVTLGLATVFPARRTRDLLSVITALAVAGLLLLFRAARPEQLVRPEGFQNFMQFVAALDAPASPWLPSEWVSEALMSWLDDRILGPAVAQLWIVAVALVALGGTVHAAGWRRAFSQAQEGAARRSAVGERSTGDRWLAFVSPGRRQLILKELRVFARDTTQWSQLVLLGVLLVVYVGNVRYLPLSGEGITTLLRNVIPFLNLALAGFVLASIAARFVFPSVSLEGRVLWLLRSSPLSMHDLLWAKFWVGAVPLLLLALVLVGATNLMLEVQPFVMSVSLGAIALLVFPLTALALAFGTYYPRYDTENAAQIPTSFGGLLFMMAAIVLIAVVAYLTGRPSSRFLVAGHFGWAYDPRDMVLPYLSAVTVCIGTTITGMRLATRRIAQH
jgi:ABC-2 type transport system permease protein